MPENLILNIRSTENGYIASFSDGKFPGEMGKEFVALAPSDLRSTVAAEIEQRLGDMIDRLSQSK